MNLKTNTDNYFNVQLACNYSITIQKEKNCTKKQKNAYKLCVSMNFDTFDYNPLYTCIKILHTSKYKIIYVFKYTILPFNNKKILYYKKTRKNV